VKKTLKLTIPGAPLNIKLESFFDKSNPIHEKWNLEVNNPEIREADAWFVLESVPDFDRVCNVPQNNLVLLSAETAQSVSYVEESESVKLFLNQFSRVYTFHQFLSPKAFHSAPFLPWMINSNHGTSIWQRHRRDVDFFAKMPIPLKSKTISVICSNQALTSHHRMRIRFVEELKKHFGTSLDWFGNGYEPVEQKWEALSDYRYTIVLENQSRHNVITEKLGDAFLANTFPFYWGAPNADEVFDPKGFRVLNIEDLKQSIKIIESAIENDLYSISQPWLNKNREIVIHEFNFLNRMLQIAEELSPASRELISLHSQPEMEIFTKLPKGYLRPALLALSGVDKRLGTNFVNLLKELYILFRYNRLSQCFRNLGKSAKKI
jgi:hypothetical protein